MLVHRQQFLAQTTRASHQIHHLVGLVSLPVRRGFNGYYIALDNPRIAGKTRQPAVWRLAPARPFQQRDRAGDADARHRPLARRAVGQIAQDAARALGLLVVGRPAPLEKLHHLPQPIFAHQSAGNELSARSFLA